MPLPESTRERHHRMRHLHFKASQGTITEPERRDMAELDDWYYKTFGFYSAKPETGTPADEPGTGRSPTPAYLLGEDGGGANETADLEGQVAGAGQYASLGDWADAVGSLRGR